MAHPLPGFTVTTPYGRPGNWAAGYHTGDDYSTKGQIGFPVHATAAGKVVLASQGTGGWGPAYGKHVVIESGDVRHGYCHLSKIHVRVGQSVAAGQKIGLSGNTGSVSGSIGPHKGAHLHYEERTTPFSYHKKDRKPGLSRRSGSGPGRSIAAGKVFVSKLRFGQKDSDSVKRLQDVLNGISLSGGRELKVTGDYDEHTRDEVKKWQQQVAKDPPQFADGNLGPRQAKLLFARTGNTVIDDT
jgi:murein DD-endopeptidase MepM/ murein hydrolase activator NlpD